MVNLIYSLNIWYCFRYNSISSVRTLLLIFNFSVKLFSNTSFTSDLILLSQYNIRYNCTIESGYKIALLLATWKDEIVFGKSIILLRDLIIKTLYQITYLKSILKDI